MKIYDVSGNEIRIFKDNEDVTGTIFNHEQGACAEAFRDAVNAIDQLIDNG